MQGPVTLGNIWERYVFFHWELLWMEHDLATDNHIGHMYLDSDRERIMRRRVRAQEK
ncbi:hypothetical protein [Pseudomonas sp. Irchel s3h17]|uniref:hypothetical protein n=1 Tax=Pseudomonas sp. Irchel s3h17 TaxID=2009182 RepID=UPI00155ED7AF|nr:hypothetical protein [Pseudomonas sp. Irchel s3h17]